MDPDLSILELADATLERFRAAAGGRYLEPLAMPVAAMTEGTLNGVPEDTRLAHRGNQWLLGPARGCR